MTLRQLRQLPALGGIHVLVVGDIMLDRYIQGRSDRLSPEAPVPVVQVEGSEDRLGGAANVALNVVSLGGRCTLVGAIGEDPSGARIEALLRKAGIEADLVVVGGWRTTLKERVVSRRKQLLRMDFEMPLPARAAQQVAELADKHLGGVDALVIEDYDKGAVARPADITSAAEAHGVVAIADPKFKPFAEYRGVAVLKPNRPEFECAVGAWPAEGELCSVGCDLARTSGVGAIALTRGDEGITLFGADGACRHIAAASVDVYDSTGAGDTVAATLGICAGLGWDVADSAGTANVAGGLVCAKPGTATVSLRELNNALDATAKAQADDADADGAPRQRLVGLAAAQRARGRGERIVFTNGCFDILHAGHVGYLNEARELGDRLIVAVNDDSSTRRLKGEGRPVMPLEQRMQVLEGLAAVDWVVPFSDDTPESLLREVRPDVLVKGGDYAPDEVVGAEFVRRYGGDVRVLSFVEDCSTTDLVERIKSG